MSEIRVVTDSTALFIDPSIISRYNITVVPVYVRFGDDRFKLGIDIGPEEFLHRMRYNHVIPRLEPPTPDECRTVYARLNREVSKIVSIHISANLTGVYRNMLAASKMLLGRCDIAVIDSQTLSVGLGILAEKAAILARQISDLEEVVRAVRRAIGRVYSVFFVQTMTTICHHNLISEAQAILGSMLGVMPFITIEEGNLVIMEKALDSSQAVDKLVEFAGEFTDFEQLVILHHTPLLTNTIRQLQDRLALELSTSNFPTHLYDGSLATFLGSDAAGIVIMENEDEDEYL
ncbi:MAG: DegV family protein [Chloroflexi bacterium]|nr:DegV family protein [Chloroflexota bacterium]